MHVKVQHSLNVFHKYLVYGSIFVEGMVLLRRIVTNDVDVSRNR